MRKTFVFIGFTIFLISVGLSGCQENHTDTAVEGDEAKIISYSVVTIWRNSEYHEEPGFYHNISDNAIYNSHYEIKGVIKNTAGKLLEELLITAVFYDINDSKLFTTDRTAGIILSLPNDSTRDFSFSIDFYDSEYYSNFDHVEFEISLP